jgi:hypothetical protein
MGSKTPPLNLSPPDGQRADDVFSRPVSPDGPPASLLLRRIASALEVPPAALYGPPDTVAPARGRDQATNADLDQECTALLHAFRRIRDPETRLRLLALVQKDAEQT